jgi:uncharacterized protein with HEPN domain
MLWSAPCRELEIVGEAARHVGETTRAGIPELPWRAMSGMRNRLFHAYFQLDPDIVWKTATEALPRAAEAIRAPVDAAAGGAE